MTASHLVYDGSEFSVLNNFDSIDRDCDSFQALCNIATLCSRATFKTGKYCNAQVFHYWNSIRIYLKLDSKRSETNIDDRKTTGDASESAILKLMEKLIGKIEEKRTRSPKVIVYRNNILFFIPSKINRFVRFRSIPSINIKLQSISMRRKPFW